MVGGWEGGVSFTGSPGTEVHILTFDTIVRSSASETLAPPPVNFSAIRPVINDVSSKLR